MLRFILDRGEATARAAVDYFAEARGYARTTVLKTLERLRAKGRLEREDREGGNVYRATLTRDELDAYVVENFVDLSLGGSVSPLVAFLMRRKGLSPEEEAEMRRLIDRLEAEQSP
jgi:predicted transcriptional regulator